MPAAPNVLEMSDEAFLALPESSFETVVEVPPQGEESPAGDEEAVADEQEETPDDESKDEAEGDETPADDSDADPAPGSAAGDTDSGGAEKPAAAADGDAPAGEIDYKAAYERVTGTFKANGKDMKVESIDDVVRLMQQGANYNRKMSGLKPSLRILKTLEKAGISEEKLNYLIDLDKKDPAAIARLVKEAGVDPLDIDLKKSETYTAANHAANETEMALDEVIGEIQDSPHYNATLHLVATKWDAVSKQAVVDSPQLLKTINDHMASGVYDLISTELENERMFGRITGMSDLQAYKHVGDMIQARNGFDHLIPKPDQRPQTKTPADPDPKQLADAQARKDKKRAASPPKAAPTAAAVAKEFNPLALSDEEFAKQFDSKYM